MSTWRRWTEGGIVIWTALVERKTDERRYAARIVSGTQL